MTEAVAMARDIKEYRAMLAARDARMVERCKVAVMDAAEELDLSEDVALRICRKLHAVSEGCAERDDA